MTIGDVPNLRAARPNESVDRAADPLTVVGKDQYLARILIVSGRLDEATHRRSDAMIASLGVAASAGVAQAEGSWHSYMSGVAPGFSSRTWHDANSDNVSTTIRLDDCTDDARGGSPANTYLQLTKERGGILPDENRGRYVLYCANTDTASWGDQPSGDYHFTVIRIDGQTSYVLLSASYVLVKY